jgi:hypothetical protein
MPPMYDSHKFGQAKSIVTPKLIKQYYTKLGNVIISGTSEEGMVVCNYLLYCHLYTILINFDDINSSKGGNQKALLLQS